MFHDARTQIGRRTNVVSSRRATQHVNPNQVCFSKVVGWPGLEPGTNPESLRGCFLPKQCASPMLQQLQRKPWILFVFHFPFQSPRFL